jgi:LCP family protein required for cell wall assembly
MQPYDVEPEGAGEGDPPEPAPFYRSGAFAGFLSFLVPGLGQFAAGARTRGLLIALPFVVALGGLLAIWFTDRSLFVRALLNPTVLLVIVGISLAFMVYRLWAIIDAYRTGRQASGGRRRSFFTRTASALVLLALLGATLVMHSWAAYVGYAAHETLVAVFDPAGPGGGATPTPAPTTPAPTPSVGATPTDTPEPSPTPTPLPTPTPAPAWAADGRLNVLLIGSDAGPGRFSQRADAIILVSVEIETGRVAAFSLPRYTYNVPLPEPAASAFECRCLVEPINALFVFAQQNPTLFPGEGELKGWMAVSGAVETLFGVTLDGMAVVDLNGFVRMVDAVGGVTVDVPFEVYDAEYPDPDGVTVHELYIPAGVQDMDGWHALAYARTRHQDGDVARMGRQQTVIRALGRELSCDLFFNLPSVLEAARDTMWTNLPLEDVPDMLRIDPTSVESHVLFDIHNPTLNADEIARIQAAVANAFDAEAPPDETPEIDC